MWKLKETLETRESKVWQQYENDAWGVLFSDWVLQLLLTSRYSSTWPSVVYFLELRRTPTSHLVTWLWGKSLCWVIVCSRLPWLSMFISSTKIYQALQTDLKLKVSRDGWVLNNCDWGQCNGSQEACWVRNQVGNTNYSGLLKAFILTKSHTRTHRVWQLGEQQGDSSFLNFRETTPYWRTEC